MTLGGQVVIVGGGECGARTALALRDLGYDGTIDLIGDEAGLPYERPPLSKAVLGADDGAPRYIATAEQFQQFGITRHASVPVTSLDRDSHRVQLGNGASLPFDKLLLATGARPRKLLRDGIEVRGLTYLRTLADCVRLRPHLSPGRHLIVLGGGFLGLEIAATAIGRGAAVTVVEAQPRILMRGVPEPISQVVADRHRLAGVDLRCGQQVTQINVAESEARVLLDGGQAITGDLVVASTGAVPNIELAATAGLEIQNGILVDTHLRTNDPSIFAAGDCCAFPLASRDGLIVRLESWRNATDQSSIAAANMLERSAPYVAVPWFWSDQFDLTLQVAGLADPSLAVIRRDLGAEAFILFHLAADGRLIAASGIGPEGAVARDVRLAEMLIAKRAYPDPLLLKRPDAKLKAMLVA